MHCPFHGRVETEAYEGQKPAHQDEAPRLISLGIEMCSHHGGHDQRRHEARDMRQEFPTEGSYKSSALAGRHENRPAGAILTIDVTRAKGLKLGGHRHPNESMMLIVHETHGLGRSFRRQSAARTTCRYL